MTDQSSNSADTIAPYHDVDSNGIPILSDVVEERDDAEQHISEMECITSTSTEANTTSNKPINQTAEIDNLKETLRQELSYELNNLIQSALLKTAEEISSQVGEVIESKLSDSLQKQMGEMLKRALEERFKKQ